MIIRNRINFILLIVGLLVFFFLRGCSRNQSEDFVFESSLETKDVSKFDGPYKFARVNPDGTIVIEKDGIEFTFELLGLIKGQWLAEDMQAFCGHLPKGGLWIEYDQSEVSFQGNLQGYGYYQWQRIHDAGTGKVLSSSYRMINASRVLAGYVEFHDDGQIQKHYELMLECAIRAYRSWVNRMKYGDKPLDGTIWTGRSKKDLESKLAEYEKMLANYQARKKSEK